MESEIIVTDDHISYNGRSKNEVRSLFRIAKEKFKDGNFYGTFEDGNLFVYFYFVDFRADSLVFFDGCKRECCYYLLSINRNFVLRIYEGLPF